MKQRQGMTAAAVLALLAIAGSQAKAQAQAQPAAASPAPVLAEAAGPGCKVIRRAQLPLLQSRGRYSVLVGIDDAVVPMMIDTGSQRAGVSPAAAAGMGLRANARTSVSAVGVGGRTANAHPYVARTLRFGTAVWTEYNLQPVNMALVGQEPDPAAPVGLIGGDMMSGYDVELDFPGHTLTLYSVTGCTGAFAPWTTRFDTLTSLSAPADLFLIPVTLNGHQIRALLDTGSNASSLSQQGAQIAGVARDALAKDPQGAYVGARGVPVVSHLHRFDSLTFGAFGFRNVPISVQDTRFGFADMLLGMDVLGARKIWLSYRTHQVFIQVPRIVRPAPAPTPRPPQRVSGRPPPF